MSTIDEWAKKHKVVFVGRSYGLYTTDTVSRSSLEELLRLGGDDGWTLLSEQNPPHGVYQFYYPVMEQGGCHYGESVCNAFWDSDQRVARGEYHGPAEPTHYRELPKPPLELIQKLSEAETLLREARVKLEPKRNDPELGNAVFAEEIFCDRIDAFLKKDKTQC